MKKVYEKPRLYAESFELTEHIADNGCGGSIASQITAKDFTTSCVWKIGGDENNLGFLESNLSCFAPGFDTQNPEFTCYEINITATGTVVTVYS